MHRNIIIEKNVDDNRPNKSHQISGVHQTENPPNTHSKRTPNTHSKQTPNAHSKQGTIGEPQNLIKIEPNWILLNAYVINLKRRKDRWDYMREHFKSIRSLKLNRFDAITDHQGWIGCAKSHVELVRQAKERGDPYVLVLEDDIQLRHPNTFDVQWLNVLEWLRSHPDSWEIFNGGPGFWGDYAKVIQILCPNLKIVSIYGGLNTHFILYSSKVYDKVLEWTPEKKAIDIFLFENFKCVAVAPLLANQKDDYSDITGFHVGYTKSFDSAESAIIQYIASHNSSKSKSNTET